MWSGDFCYYFPKGHGLYLNAGLGPVLNAPEFGDSLTGFGFYFGGGWEFAKHFSVGADYTIGSVGNDFVDYSIAALAVYIKALAY